MSSTPALVTITGITVNFGTKAYKYKATLSLHNVALDAGPTEGGKGGVDVAANQTKAVTYLDPAPFETMLITSNAKTKADMITAKFILNNSKIKDAATETKKYEKTIDLPLGKTNEQFKLPFGKIGDVQFRATTPPDRATAAKQLKDLADERKRRADEEAERRRREEEEERRRLAALRDPTAKIKALEAEEADRRRNELDGLYDHESRDIEHVLQFTSAALLTMEQCIKEEDDDLDKIFDEEKEAYYHLFLHPELRIARLHLVDPTVARVRQEALEMKQREVQERLARQEQLEQQQSASRSQTASPESNTDGGAVVGATQHRTFQQQQWEYNSDFDSPSRFHGGAPSLSSASGEPSPANNLRSGLSLSPQHMSPIGVSLANLPPPVTRDMNDPRVILERQAREGVVRQRLLNRRAGSNNNSDFDDDDDVDDAEIDELLFGKDKENNKQQQHGSPAFSSLDNNNNNSSARNSSHNASSRRSRLIVKAEEHLHNERNPLRPVAVAMQDALRPPSLVEQGEALLSSFEAAAAKRQQQSPNSAARRHVSFQGTGGTAGAKNNNSTNVNSTPRNNNHVNNNETSLSPSQKAALDAARTLRMKAKLRAAAAEEKRRRDSARIEIDLPPAPPLMTALLHLNRGNTSSNIMFNQQHQSPAAAKPSGLMNSSNVSPSRREQASALDRSRHVPLVFGADGSEVVSLTERHEQRSSPQQRHHTTNSSNSNKLNPTLIRARQPLPMHLHSAEDHATAPPPPPALNSSHINSSNSVNSNTTIAVTCEQQRDQRRQAELDEIRRREEEVERNDPGLTYWKALAPRKGAALVGVRVPVSAAVNFERTAIRHIQSVSPPRRVAVSGASIPTAPRNLRTSSPRQISVRNMLINAKRENTGNNDNTVTSPLGGGPQQQQELMQDVQMMLSSIMSSQSRGRSRPAAGGGGTGGRSWLDDLEDHEVL